MGRQRYSYDVVAGGYERPFFHVVTRRVQLHLGEDPVPSRG